ncbi:MAG TPA: acyl-ACP--UDP-N-acetylglucosamine O-acyltransferase [Candidatus Xenobia bacterium]|nr:acyl-ACP--UDP-N-acetylglucosamine O-acyltransferase [Candidatus Xenobia bacterium]
MEIHPTAIVSAAARLPATGRIGPYCVIEEDVELGEGCELDSHVVLHTGVRLGREVRVHAGVVLGHTPMVRGSRTARSYLEIGDRTILFPHATIERGHGEGEATRIGADCFLMTHVHIGHNSQVGNSVTIGGGVAMAGYSLIEDHAFIGGGAVQHQHSRVGRLAMVGGNVRINRDIPPFILAAEFDAAARGLNLVGLRRQNIPSERIAALKQAYRLLYRSQLPLAEALERIEKEVATEEARYFANFIRQSKRGICRE